MSYRIRLIKVHFLCTAAQNLTAPVEERSGGDRGIELVSIGDALDAATTGTEQPAGIGAKDLASEKGSPRCPAGATKGEITAAASLSSTC